MNTASVIAPAYIHSSIKRRRNTWYSVRDGNWSDPMVWQSNATKRYSYPGQNIAAPVSPQAGDDVYINHTVTLQIGTLVVVNNLYVSGNFKANNSALGLTVNGDLQVTGSVDFTGSAIGLYLYGVNNFVNTLVSAGTSTFYYTRIGDQPVLSLLYYNLNVFSYVGAGVFDTGTKYLVANTTVSNNLRIENSGTTFELGIYNLTVLGTTINGGSFSKTGSGSILFVGAFGNFAQVTNTAFSLTGNPTVETRGGFYFSNYFGGFYSGTGLWTATTNSQSYWIENSGLSKNWDCPILISGAITLTFYAGGTFFNNILGVINGNNAASTLVAKDSFYFGTVAATSLMTTGIFDFTSQANVIGYNFNGNYTIPYTSFIGLFVYGTGIKTLSGTTTLSATLVVSNSTLQLSSFNLTVAGTTTMTGLAVLLKNGSGNVIFANTLIFTNALTASIIDFSIGNPTIEMRNGIATNNGATYSFALGTNTLTLSTNNQTLTPAPVTIANQIVISGAITVSFNSNFTITGSLNGNNAASTLNNIGLVAYKILNAPMVTGILQTNNAANIWQYNLTGNQNVAGGTYRIIEFGGSGVKTLQGNVVVNVTAGGSQSTTGTATINLNGFTITTI